MINTFYVMWDENEAFTELSRATTRRGGNFNFKRLIVPLRRKQRSNRTRRVYEGTTKKLAYEKAQKALELWRRENWQDFAIWNY